MSNVIQLIDSSQEKTVIGYQIEQKIAQALKNKQKNLIFVNRKQGGFLCADCGYIFRCPRCNTVLQFNQNIIFCNHCTFQSKPIAKCPECQGHNLRSFGFSLQSVKNELVKLFPKKNINLVFKEIASQKLAMTSSIMIATKEIFRHPDVKFDLIIIPSWEQMQFGGDFDQKQNIINTVVQLIEISNKKLIIQTDNLEDEFLQNIKAGNLDDIYERELYERKKYHYPPFYKLIKFIYKHKNSKIAETEIAKLNNKLQKLIPKIEILGPSETKKLRDKYYWQLILKIPAQKYSMVNRLIIDNESKLQLSKYLIDVNPLNLI